MAKREIHRTHLNCNRYSIKFRYFISTIISTIKLERQSLWRKRFIRHFQHAIDNQVLLHYLIYNRSVASISSTWRRSTTAPHNSVPLNWRGITSSLPTSFIYKVNFQTLSPKGKYSFYPYHSRLKPLLDKFNYFTDLIHPGTFKVPLMRGMNSSKTFNRFAINYEGKEIPIGIAVANKPPGVLLSTPNLVGRSNTACGIVNSDTPPLNLPKSLKDQIIDAKRCLELHY